MIDRPRKASQNILKEGHREKMLILDYDPVGHNVVKAKLLIAQT